MKKLFLRGFALTLAVLMAFSLTACRKGEEVISVTSEWYEAGASKDATASATDGESKSEFESGASVDTDIGINNSNASANVDANKAGASVVARNEVEGVDGSFKDVTLKETKMDLKGRKVVFALNTPEKVFSATGDSDAQRCYAALKAIEKDYNCTIELVQHKSGEEGAKEIATAKASGKVLYNVMLLQANAANSLLKTTGYGADLRNVKTIGFNNNDWNAVFTLSSSYKMKVMGVGVRYDWIEQNIMFFNKSLANKYNLGNFYDMVNSGKWTVNNFISICETYKNRSGSKNYAVESMFPQTFLITAYANWTSPLAISAKTSSYIFNGTSSQVLDALTTVQNAVKKGLFNPNYTKTAIDSNGLYKQVYKDYETARDNFVNGKALFFIGSNGIDVLPYIYKNAIDDYGLLPIPRGDSSTNYSTVITNTKYFSLLDGSPTIEEDGAILTAIANRTNIATKDIEANNKIRCRDSQSVKMLTQNYKFKQILNVELSPGDIAAIYHGAAVPAVLGQEKSPKQAMESIESKITTEINKIYN